MGDVLAGAPAGVIAGVEWMMQRLDRDGIGSEMMCGNPQRMSDACQQWMAADPPDGTDVDAESWCGSMAGWMADHMGDWSGRGR